MRVVELHVEGVATVVVGCQQREAVLDQRALVDDQVGELARHDDATGHDRHAPHDSHRRDPATFAAPAADDLVGEVDRPVRVGLDGLLRPVRRRAEVARLLVVVEGRNVRDHSEELDPGRRARGHGDERAPVPGPVREEHEVAGLANLSSMFSVAARNSSPRRSAQRP